MSSFVKSALLIVVASSATSKIPVQIGDGALVQRIRQGDEKAIDMLYRRHARLVAGLIGRMIGNRADAEDLLQDTFVDAFAKLDSLRECDAFRSWLCRIAISKARGFLRKRRFFLKPVDSILHELVSEDASAEHIVLLEDLDQALRQFPAEERVIWTLRFVEGYQLSEIAKLCEVSLATTKRRLTSASARLRRALEIHAQDIFGATP